MSVDLKPCPFCGGEAKIIWELNGFETVECTKCGAVVDGWGVWNKRAERTCHWLGLEEWENPVQCSECGVWVVAHVALDSNYCPNCGAKVVHG